MKRALVLSDFHCPFVDKTTLSNIVYPVVETGFDDIIIAGDLLDCYGLSRFDKDPQRIDSLQEELDVATSILSEIHQRAPHAKKILIKGNHEERLGRALRETKTFHSLRQLRWPVLLELHRFGFKWEETIFRVNRNFIIVHGSVIRKFSGYTARAMLEKYGVSGISGHSHRMALHCSTDYSGEYLWVECGHLCDISKVDYVEDKHGGVANWQQGFSILFYDANRFFVNPIYIKNGCCVVEGKLYGEKK